MATAQTATAEKKTPVTARSKLKKIGRDKRNLKIATDKEFATKYFEAKSKRSIDKKAAFKKKKSKKK